MLIHVNHRLIAINLLVHVNLELRYGHEVPPSEVIEKHDSRELPVIVTQHSSYQVFIRYRHVYEILAVLSADTTGNVKIVLAEVESEVTACDLAADSDSRLELVHNHGGIGQVADSDERFYGFPVVYLEFKCFRIDCIICFDL